MARTANPKGKAIAPKINLPRATGYNRDQITVLRNQVAKSTTDAELAYFLNVCRATGLNPFNREVWCYKNKKGGLVIFTGHDGVLRKAQENPNFNGVRCGTFHENDNFKPNIPAGTIEHDWNGHIKKKDRGELVGAYCFVFRKDGEPSLSVVFLEDYKVSGQNVWKDNPEAMILKVARAHALKQSFGLSGIQLEYDWTPPTDTGVVVPVKARTVYDDLDKAKIRAMALMEGKTDEKTAEIKQRCIEASEQGADDIDFVNEVIKELEAIHGAA